MEPKNEQLKKYWARTVAELASRPALSLEPGEAERHRIMSLLLMAIIHHYWNGNKYGRHGVYPWNEPANAAVGRFLDADYAGHNIAALAVDADGFVIDFDFNHNTLFNSSAEHAEARLIRRPGQPRDDYSTFEDVTVYTSLESCSQCSGVMALARVRQVVYLQPDHGMYMIGNIIRNLTEGTKLEAPAPLPADQLALGYFERLDKAFEDFAGLLKTRPFFEPSDSSKKPNASHSVTSFLCTRAARDLYSEAREEFTQLAPEVLAYPDHRPLDRQQKRVESALTNAEMLIEAKGFLGYAISSGRRGTPHH
jgi:tRNA(Arg) A34 adenosine deaminase TadA